ncbi:MAG: S41 family peptidase [Deltaproteobacteria bacterium]|nr:S41 family peptidase [Deltaproteobacteria bacterium]
MGKFLSGRLVKPVSFFIFVVLILALANSNYCFAKDNKAALNANTVKSLRLFSRVYTLIKNNYIKKESSKKLIFGAVEGMVSTLDPHTYFLTPSEFRQMKSETSGEFVGIGIKISAKNHYIVVISPIDGSPAARAGIKAGDIIEKINNISTYNMNIMRAVALLHGRAGTGVSLSVERKGFKKPKVFKLIRENIILKSVKYMILPHHIAYVRISSFQDHTNSQLLKALKIINLKEHGIKGLIIDLRNNPGGLLNQAVKVCSDFVKSGVIVYTKGRIKSQDEKYFALGKRPPFKYPVVVLVNAGTASAAEITAGSLQAHKRAIVVGTRTFGKGSVQTVYTLPDGTGIGLTTAFYFLPNGVSVQDTGVIPNFVIHSSKDFIFVKPLPKLREVDLRHHFKNPESGKIKERHNYKAFKVYYKKDDQFRFAYELLKSWNSIKSIGVY